MSPLALLYVKVGSLRFLSLSGYDILDIPGIILLLFSELFLISLYQTFYVVTILIMIVEKMTFLIKIQLLN